MIGRMLFLIILVPLLDLYISIKIGAYLGAFPTVALVVFTALLGIVLVRFEGLRTLQQIRQSKRQPLRSICSLALAGQTYTLEVQSEE
jgi:UPF0716 protein FxsA